MIRRCVGVSGAGIAVTFSLLGHAGIALFAAHHSRVAPGHVATVESTLAAFDAEFVTAEDDDAPAPEAPPTVSTAGAARPAPRALARAASVAATASTTADVDAQPAAAAPAAAQASAGPHFAMTVAPAFVGSAPGVIESAVPGSNSGPSGGSVSVPITAENADIPAQLRAGNVPAYTAAALSAGVEANVPLEIIVNESGVVVSARVLERVGYGLDEAARQGILAYRFTPAVRLGKLVAVRMQWLMRFQLR